MNFKSRGYPKILLLHCCRKILVYPQSSKADLFFAGRSSDTPLKDAHPGLSSEKAMAIVQVEFPIPDGRYVIKNRAADIFWNRGSLPMGTILRPIHWRKRRNPVTSTCRWASILQLFKCSEDNSLSKWDITLILIVAYPWHYPIHPGGCVSILLGLRCQFCGGG